MRLTHVARALSVCTLLLLAPSPVLADHCGSSATITPVVGQPGTTFVFRTNLGTPSELDLYRNGALIRSVALSGSGDVRYSIQTGPGDAGAWRARAEARDNADCAAEATFKVVGAPDTSTDPKPRGDAPAWIILVAIGLGPLFVGLSRFAGRTPPA
jgi:hypothetical protein